MDTKQVATVNPGVLDELADLAEQAQDYIEHSKAPATLKAYRSDWAQFSAWCASRGVESLPALPETIACYLTHLAASHRTSTIQRRIATISQAHEAAGYASPTKDAAARATWRGIRRAKGTAPSGKAPVLCADVRAMIEKMPDGLMGVRDRALLLVGFAGAFRRSELVGFDLADVEFTSDGVVVTLRHSKTDQEGEGRKVGIPFGSNPSTCPVRSLQAWIEAGSISEGALFLPINRHGQIMAGRLSDKGVARMVKRYAALAGLDPTQYSGHSLRAGLATAAAAAGASERSIMAQTGHRSVAMVRRYIRDGSLFRENAAAVVGL